MIIVQNGNPELTVKAPKPENIVPLKGTARPPELHMRAGPPKNAEPEDESRLSFEVIPPKENILGPRKPAEQPRAMIWSCNRCAHEFKSPNRPSICENERCNGKSFTMLR
jgi:hypothetical protein